MSPRRWTRKSTRTFATELQQQRFQVSSVKVGQLLKKAGFSLQVNRKTIEVKQHPDLNALFEFLAKRVSAVQRNQQRVVSVDTKKKEVLGNSRTQAKPTVARRIRFRLRRTISPTVH
jgi:hypothetical protein